jgi:Alkylmercury lyase
MSNLQTTTITDVLGDARWAADRIAGLAPAARRLYALILYRFTEGGPPDRDELSDLGFSADALPELVERDLAQLGPDAQIVVAYPFSASPTRHRVLTEDGRAYWAMCAIDALGMPFLLHQAAEIRAREPGGDRAIKIAIDPDAQTVRADPADAAVAVARAGDGCAAGCACRTSTCSHRPPPPSATSSPPSCTERSTMFPARWRRDDESSATCSTTSAQVQGDDVGGRRPPASRASRRRRAARRGAPRDRVPRGALPGAINIPLKQLDATTAQQLDPARAVVVYCWDGL